MTRRKEKTILCIDDEQVALSGWCLYLQSKGYTVVGASSPEEGLQVFGVQPIDVVVLDYSMPELNGSTVASLMKQIKPHVPIILFTGSSTVPERVRKNIDHHILKGGEPSELLSKVDVVLGVAAAGQVPE